MYQIPSDATIENPTVVRNSRSIESHTPDVGVTGWRRGLPVLTGGQVVLRELRSSDAASLFAMLSTDEVSRFMSPPPTTIDGYEQFIAWAHRQRSAGAFASYAVTLKGFDTAIGLFQVRQLDTNFTTAEWGFAIGSPFWGTGVFADAASLVVDFLFGVVGVNSLEARAVIRNGRGNGALLKIGAVQEGVLRNAFLRNGQQYDQVLYAILADDWRQCRELAATSASAQVH